MPAASGMRMGKGGSQEHSQGHFKVILTDTNPEQGGVQLTFTVHLCDSCRGPALYSNGTCVVLLHRLPQIRVTLSVSVTVLLL